MHHVWGPPTLLLISTSCEIAYYGDGSVRESPRYLALYSEMVLMNENCVGRHHVHRKETARVHVENSH